MNTTIDISTSSVGTLHGVTFMPAASSFKDKLFLINDLEMGTTNWQERSFLPPYEEHSSAPEDVEQLFEDASEDDSEEVWEAFLEIEPHYHTTNRWLAES